MFGARAPARNTTEFHDLIKIEVHFTPGDGRTAREQAAYQFAALAISVGIALLGGLLTGINDRLGE